MKGKATINQFLLCCHGTQTLAKVTIKVVNNRGISKIKREKQLTACVSGSNCSSKVARTAGKVLYNLANHYNKFCMKA